MTKNMLFLLLQGVHEKLKPFVCSLCSTSFSKKSTLKMHVRSVHDKLRPFTCDQCDAKFSQVRIPSSLQPTVPYKPRLNQLLSL